MLKQAVLKRKVGAFSSENNARIQKAPRQALLGLLLEREEVTFDHSFNQTFYLLSIDPNRFCFPTNLEEGSELAKRNINWDFSKLPKKSPSKTQKHPKNRLVAQKSIKHYSLKNSHYFQNEKQVRDLFYEVNPDFSIPKTTLPIIQYEIIISYK